MMLRKSTVAALSVLVAVATAHPYAEWNSARYRWNDLLTARDEEVGARVRSQATIETCSCALVTETWDSESYSVRVCTADCPNKVCWETSVDRCNPTAYFSLGYLVSSTQVSVAGEYVAVEFYLTHAGVCFRLDDAHLRAETCSRKSDSCLLSCPRGPDICFENTLSCVGDVCQCKTGYLLPNCCQCDTTNFYLPNCTSFCRDNCSRFRPPNVGGCLTCHPGFTDPPECCLPEPKPQTDPPETTTPETSTTETPETPTLETSTTEIPETPTPEPSTTETPETPTPETLTPETPTTKPYDHLFFYIDATDSNKFENFCPLIIVLQMIVAIFNPSPSSEIQIGSLLFSDNAKYRGPSPVFETDTSCSEAVDSLLALMQEFGICLDNHLNYDSSKFLSMCGDGTSAVPGLRNISERIHALTNSPRNSTVLMITDGIIEDGREERMKVLSDLESAGVTIIEAGYGDADLSTMKLYADPDNIMIDDDPVELGKAIVNKLKVKGVLHDKYANDITASLENAQGDEITLPLGKVSTLELFCRCQRDRKVLKEPAKTECTRRTIKYPTCGGDVSIGVPLKNTLTQERELDSLILEKEILAAVESVLERFKG